MKSLTISLIIIFAFLLNACVGHNTIGEAGIEGQTWVLTTYDRNDSLNDRRPTLQFDVDKISGNTGCNHYSGIYQIKSDEISIEGISHTEMACLNPDGLMEQERIYLELLGNAKRFELADGVLTIFTASEQTLIFEIQADTSQGATSTLEPLMPTPTLFQISALKKYHDPVAAISLFIPENWVVTGVFPGQSAILQSYPADKYVGGEGLEPGDTKCDLNIRPAGTRAADLIQQWQADSMTEIVSETEFILQSGSTGQRFIIDSMGRSTVFVVEVKQRVILLTCFGDFTPIDAIAASLKASDE